MRLERCVTYRLALFILAPLVWCACGTTTPSKAQSLTDFIAGVSSGSASAVLQSGNLPAGSSFNPPPTVIGSSVATTGGVPLLVESPQPFQVVNVSVGGANAVSGFWQLTVPAPTTAQTIVVNYGGAIPSTNFNEAIQIGASPGAVGPPTTVPITTPSSTLTVTPAVQSVGAASGSFSAAVATTGAWTAVSNQSFVTITSGAAGTGNGTIAYSVSHNTGAERLALITVSSGTATATLTVDQAVDVAAAVTVSFSPNPATFLNYTPCVFQTAVGPQPEPFCLYIWRTTLTEANNVGVSAAQANVTGTAGTGTVPMPAIPAGGTVSFDNGVFCQNLTPTGLCASSQPQPDRIVNITWSPTDANGNVVTITSPTETLPGTGGNVTLGFSQIVALLLPPGPSRTPGPPAPKLLQGSERNRLPH